MRFSAAFICILFLASGVGGTLTPYANDPSNPALVADALTTDPAAEGARMHDGSSHPSHLADASTNAQTTSIGVAGVPSGPHGPRAAPPGGADPLPRMDVVIGALEDGSLGFVLETVFREHAPEPVALHWLDRAGIQDLPGLLLPGEPVEVTLALPKIAETTHAFKFWAQTAETGIYEMWRTFTIAVTRDGIVQMDKGDAEYFQVELANTLDDSRSADDPGVTVDVAVSMPTSAAPGFSEGYAPTMDDDTPEESGDDPLNPPEITLEATPLSAATHFQVKACWKYYEPLEGGHVRQRWIVAQVWDADSHNSDDLLWSSVLGYSDMDANGCFYSDSIPKEEPGFGLGNQDVYWRVFLSNSAVTMSDWNCACTIVYRHPDGPITPGASDTLIEFSPMVPSTSSRHYPQLFQYGLNSWDYSVNYAGVSGSDLGNVDIEYGIGCPPFSGNEVPCYLDNENINWPNEWAPVQDVLGHEYAHYVMDRMYGPTFEWPDWLAHSRCENNQNLEIAWNEGWANYYGTRISYILNEPGADQDVRFDFSPFDNGWSIESRSCPSYVEGYDDEWNVATALWDIQDSASTESWDDFDYSERHITDLMNECEPHRYNEFYGGSCGWESNGYNVCHFAKASFFNQIPEYDTIPRATVTSQGSYTWVRDTLTVTGTAQDDECPIVTMEFRVSSDDSCSIYDYWAGSDSSSPFQGSINTHNVPDDSAAWTCARAYDGIRWSSWARSSSSIGIDNSPPVASLGLDRSPTWSDWHSTAVGVTLTCSDTLSGITEKTYRANGGAWQTYSGKVTLSSEGQNTFEGKCKNGAGDTTTSTTTFNVDTRSPTTSVGIPPADGANGWFVTAPSLSLTCADPSPGSGCAATDKRIGATGSWTSYTGPFAVTQEGTTAVSGQSRDRVNHQGPVSTDYVSVDLTNPSPEIYSPASIGSSWYTTRPQVDLRCQDNQSGMDWIGYRFGTTGSWTTYGSPFTPTNEGVLTLQTKCDDEAGRSAQTSRTYQVDSRRPDTELGVSGPEGDGNWHTGPVSVWVICSDPTPGSGCLNDYMKIGAGSWITNPGTRPISAEGTTAVQHYASDVAGHNAFTETTYVYIDSVAPVSSVNSPAIAGPSRTFTVGWSATDATSLTRCYDVQVRTGGSAWTNWRTCTTSTSGSYTGTEGATHEFRARAYDNAGNMGAFTQPTATYVNRAPVASAGPDQRTTLAQSALYGVSVDASGSYDPDGHLVEYCFDWGDGTPQSCGAQSSATHQYFSSGSYTVVVTVEDNHGRQDTDSARITVALV